MHHCHLRCYAMHKMDFILFEHINVKNAYWVIEAYNALQWIKYVWISMWSAFWCVLLYVRTKCVVLWHIQMHGEMKNTIYILVTRHYVTIILYIRRDELYTCIQIQRFLSDLQHFHTNDKSAQIENLNAHIFVLQ